MYRYAVAEYEDRPIVDLLEIGRDDDDSPMFELAEDTEQPAKIPVRQGAKPTLAASTAIKPVSPGSKLQPETAPIPAFDADSMFSDYTNNDLAARSASLGMAVDGLDD